MIEINALHKNFATSKSNVAALNNVDLKINKSEFILIKGESGSGKSTLLFALGGMLHPSSGDVIVNNKNLFSLSEKERRSYRANDIGFVFQSYHLLSYLTVLENILLPNTLADIQLNKSDAIQLATELGIEKRLNHKPSQLSAGEKQRVALARALITKPSLILADEPTGNLDERNTIEVMNYFKKYQQEGGTVVMVTHGSLADDYATRTIKLHQGKLIEE
ncbi:ABC transporter ATP-binding protein [Flavivirga spongiicola]|uniref:ABC transporter ATP-binding protein n=1 Tax=Flavivirga spongiicola TaxID=421621 RepID=A0ABU7XNR5_9FLAO|nr:ABC transporter ATP-binding protein [Flavivirga sp. MEBiC05379]MDO5977410.1 ABC transporter ATP-binding protein [Flavivirga sp. MEBiC05379]